MIQGILIQAGNLLFELVTLLIFVNIIFSWVNPDPNNIFVKTIYGLTEPILSPLRRFTIIGPLDLSAFAAILLMQIVLFPLYKMVVMFIF
ncbi:YggT family protein [Acetobacterium malicum]|uniref:YggT family protein n=2 Tax=Acetobacterium malicum TaxID=52692 RepID=A0ABR6YT71_9FIRM|nr:YggT family protein [Acetobacterium malicum]